MRTTQTTHSVISLTSPSLKPDVWTRMAVWYLHCTFAGPGLAYLPFLCVVRKENLGTLILGLRFRFLAGLAGMLQIGRILLNLQNVDLESILYIIKRSLAVYD